MQREIKKACGEGFAQMCMRSDRVSRSRRQAQKRVGACCVPLYAYIDQQVGAIPFHSQFIRYDIVLDQVMVNQIIGGLDGLFGERLLR